MGISHLRKCHSVQLCHWSLHMTSFPINAQLASSDHVCDSPLDHSVIVAQVIHYRCDSLPQIIQVCWGCGENLVFHVAPQKEVTGGNVWGPTNPE